MGLLTRALVVGGVTALSAWTAWGLYVRRTTESIPYDRIERLDGAELRRYPQSVLVETTAPDQRTGFRRLFRYISGENDGGGSVEMTSPVESTQGESVAITSPVETADGGQDDQIRMAFYLPPEYDPETAPEPTDSSVWLRTEPERTLAVTRFSWFTPEWRVDRQKQKLLAVLQDSRFDPTDTPSLLRYNDPRTPPYMRRNEVAVEVENRS